MALGKIVIADDHVVIRQGLKALITKSGDWEVVAEASNGLEVVPLVENHVPDVVIVDLSMPSLGGIEAITRLARLASKPTVLVLSAKSDEMSVNEAMKAGAKGFIPKTASSDELMFALEALKRGQTYLSPSVCAGVLGRNGEEGAGPLGQLSPREREVMKLLCEGRPNRDVAKTLHISPRTVDTHRTNIMKKLGIKSNAELVQVAIRSGLVEG